ncbi:hypothetical protein D3C71_1922690 [compost metagenome]
MNGAARDARPGEGWRGVVSDLSCGQIPDHAALNIIGDGAEYRHCGWGQIDNHVIAVGAGADVPLWIGRDHCKGV